MKERIKRISKWIFLRQNLKSQEFMVFPDDRSRLPHLLEQEVFSLSKILEIVMKLYTDHANDEAYQDLVEPWVQRYVQKSILYDTLIHLTIK